MPPVTSPTLSRSLGLADAVYIGLGSMIGAGIFAAFAPAAQSAGAGLLVGLVIAAIVAFCNATSSAQLAASHPMSGGTYLYGREQLGAWWGFLAGWSFVIGKTASCAAMALTFATYAVPEAWGKPVAIAAVVVLVAINYRGVTRTALLIRILVVIVLAVLVIIVASGAAAPHVAIDPLGDLSAHGWYGVLQSAGLLFFAFAGYARIATMGEEVRNPARTIPRAIVIALSITVAIYGTVAVVLLGTLGSTALARATAPLGAVVQASGWALAGPVVLVGAAAASLGALLGLIAGIGRTALAMAREGDLPRGLAAVHPRFGVPHRAEVALAIVVCLVILAVDVRSAIAFSSFGVLLYYLVANLAAFTQRPDQRRYPRALPVIGAMGCVVLVVTLPIVGSVTGVGVLAIGVVYRLVRLRRESQTRHPGT